MTKTPRCPVCRREGDQACIALALVPGGRVQWVSTAPHPARLERDRD